MNELKEYTKEIFENIKHIDEVGNEYWSARELQKALEYSQWRRFESIIDKVKISCTNQNDRFSLSVANGGTANYGNNVLTYPIGLITADEVNLARAIYDLDTFNDNYYLYGEKSYYTLTPYSGNAIANSAKKH